MDFINEFVNKKVDLENMRERLSVLCFTPHAVNTNVSEDGTVWGQLICSYISNYNRTDEMGELYNDNESIKTLVIKFPKKYLDSQKVTTNEFKKYFEKYVLKKFLMLPVTEEKDSYTYSGILENGKPKRVLIKNQSECTVSDTFNLRTLIDTLNKEPINKEPINFDKLGTVKS